MVKYSDRKKQSKLPNMSSTSLLRPTHLVNWFPKHIGVEAAGGKENTIFLLESVCITDSHGAH